MGKSVNIDVGPAREFGFVVGDMPAVVFLISWCEILIEGGGAEERKRETKRYGGEVWRFEVVGGESYGGGLNVCSFRRVILCTLYVP